MRLVLIQAVLGILICLCLCGSALRVFEECDETTTCPGGAKCVWRGCDGRKCICQNETLPSSDFKTCVPGIELSGLCKQGDVCNSQPFSKCMDSKCVCLDGYRLSRDGKHCVSRMKGNYTGAEYGQPCTPPNVVCVFDLVCNADEQCGCPSGNRKATKEEMFSGPYDYRYCVPEGFTIGKPVDVNGPECSKPGTPSPTTTTSTTEATTPTTTTETTTTTTTTTSTTTPSTTTTTTTLPTTSSTSSTTSTTTSTSTTTTPSTTTSTTTTPSTTTSTTTTPSTTTSTTTTPTSSTTPTTVSTTVPTTTLETTQPSTPASTSKSTTSATTTTTAASTPSTSSTTKATTLKTKPSTTTTLVPSTTQSSTKAPSTKSSTTVAATTEVPSTTKTTTPTSLKPSITASLSSVTTLSSTNSTGKATSSNASKSSQSITSVTVNISHSSTSSRNFSVIPPHNFTTSLASSTSISTTSHSTSLSTNHSSSIPSVKTTVSSVTSGVSSTSIGPTVGLGDPCRNKACPKHSECLTDACNVARCRCVLGYADSPDEKSCWKLSTLGELCGDEKICQGANTICSERGICECESRFERSDSGRWCRLKSSWFIEFPVIGEECTDSFSSQCYMYFEQECVAGKCQCKEGFREVANIPDQNAIYPDTVQCRNASFDDGERKTMLCSHQSKTKRDYDVYSRAKSKIHRIQGAIIGGSVGFVALLGIVIGVLVLIRWKRKGRRQMIRDTSSTASTDATSRYSFKIPRPFTHFVGSKEFDSTQIAYPNTVFDRDDHTSVNTEPKPDVVNVGTLLRQSQNQNLS